METLSHTTYCKIITFLKAVNDPEEYGFAVTEEVRKDAQKLLQQIFKEEYGGLIWNR